MAKSRLTEVEEIFDRKLKKLRTPQQWETTLKATSNFWKITFCEAMLLLEQLPKAKVCATYEVWNKVERYVKRGERSAAVFTSRQDTKLKYLFDISQTRGKTIAPKWKMTEAIADGIVGKYNSENPETVESFEEYLQKVLDKKLVMLYNYNSKLYANIAADPRTAALIAESVRCIVMTRCGIDEKYSFAAITELNIQPAILVELGNTATEIAKELLTDIDRIIRRKEYEQYSNLRRGHLRYPLRGEKRTSLPHIQESGTGGAVDMGEKGSRSDSGDGQNGTRPHQYEWTLPHNMGGDSSSVRGGIQLDGGDNEKEISPNGELGTAGTAERGDILGSESSEVGLPPSSGEMADSSLLGTGGTVGDKEDNPEINDSSLTEDTTEYDEAEFDEEADSAFYYPDEDDEPLQMSLFGEDEPKQNTPDPNYSFFVSKPRYEVRDENIGTHTRRELLLDEIMRGSGFQDGKFRIEQFYKDNNPSIDELATMMKKEYGTGGHSGDGDISYSDHDGSGIKITLDVNDENLIVKYSWTEAARCAAELIKAGQYITQKDIDNRIHNAKFHLRHGYGRPFDSFYYENAVKTLALYNIPLDEVLGVEGMSELNDMFYQLYDDKCAILEQPTTSTPYPVENARANKLTDLRLRFSQENDFYLTAYVDGEDVIIRTLGDDKADVVRYLTTNGITVTGYEENKVRHGVAPYLTQEGIKNNLKVGDYIRDKEDQILQITSIDGEFSIAYKIVMGQSLLADSGAIFGRWKQSIGEIELLSEQEVNAIINGEATLSQKPTEQEIRANLKVGDYFRNEDGEILRIVSIEGESNMRYINLSFDRTGALGGFIAGHWRGYFDKIEPLTEEQANAILDSIERAKQPPVVSAPTYTFRITDADYFNSDKAYDDDFECEEFEDALLEFNQRLDTIPNHISVKLSLEVKYSVNGNDEVSLYPIVQWDAREEQLTIYKETATNPDVAMNEELTRSIRNLSERDSDFAYAEVFIKETDSEDRFTLMQTSQDYPDTDNMYAIWDNLYGVYYTDNDGNMSVFPSMEAAQSSLDYLNDHPYPVDQAIIRQPKKVRHGVAPTVDTEQPTETAAEPEKKISEKKNPSAQNYHFPQEFSYAQGPKAKYADNVAAIKTLYLVESEHRNATPEEQEILAHYSGWGGISDAFDESKENWRKEYAELKILLSDDDYAAARASTLTAFYTDPYIINSIYNTLERFGFKGGEILDPSMGTGNFYGQLPESIGNNSKLYGVELDSISARISRLLYPNASIQHKGFEQAKFLNDSMDIVIGNVPFGDYTPYDRNYENKYVIHDYFFIKSLDKLKAGGIAALITSAGTLDKYEQTVRCEMYRKAELIGAVRLPNTAFKTAGTSVVSDILFLQKREKELVVGVDEIEYPEWTRCGSRQIDGYWCIGSNYYLEHPEMILGETKRVSGRYGETNTVVETGDLAEQLETALSTLSAEFTAKPTEYTVPDEEQTVEGKPKPSFVRPYTFFVSNADGKLYYAENETAVPFKGKDKDDARIRRMCEVMYVLDETIKLQQQNCSDSELKAAQTKLNIIYDRFVKDYGYLNSRTNSGVFADDVRCSRLMALEIADENNTDSKQTYSKADIFTMRTIVSHKEPTSAETALEALHISLNLRQKVDLQYMSELCGKDKDEIIDELGDKIYLNPAKYTGNRFEGWEIAEEYLSGNVVDKLGFAMIMAEQEPMYFSRNVEALREHQPVEVPIEDISFRLGSIFIPVEMYQDFIWETFETDSWHRSTYSQRQMIELTYRKTLNEWHIENKHTEKGNAAVNEVYGTKRANAYELCEMLLNQKKAEIKDRKEDVDGKVTYVLNKTETILAREKQAKIEAAFKEWVLAEPSRVDTVVKIYNSRYNSFRHREFDGSYVSVPGMSEQLQLRPHQKDVIARIAATGTCLMAHDVGAGKTAAMAAAGMYLKSIGTISKPMYVVPNAVVAQFGEEFQRFFPDANILVATKDDLSKQKRRRFLSKISVGNYDAIIIPQSQFESIPLSLERQEAMYSRKITEVTDAINELKSKNGERMTVKTLERQRKSMEAAIDRLRADFKKDDFITFEELGVDFLFVDEAHNYKNLALFSKMRNVAGVNTSSNSQKAFDMEMKCRYLQEINNGGGVVFATGTPISNSVSELFVMQYYLQYEQLRQLDLDYFDNWASVFGVITQDMEVKPSGDGFRMRTRFSQFTNIPELLNIVSEVFDIVKKEQLNLPLPEIEGGKPQMIICDKSYDQELQTDEGMERARRIEAKLVTPEQDNMLAICTYMTKVALDGRIVNPDAEDYEGSKINRCIEEILRIDEEHPQTAQVVFCDTNIPQGDAFSVYKDIKEKLIATGKYLPEEIAFIHDASNDKQRLELFQKVNEAQVRVILGSTGKLGTGVNMQRRLIAMHHLDAPYRPSDIEQRNGRGIRQGNINDTVTVNYYATKGTFDTYRWQILEKKQNFIAQIMSGKATGRTCEDIDDVALTFAEMKAATTENPLVAEKMTVDNEVSRLSLLKTAYIAQQHKLKNSVETEIPDQLAKAEKKLELAKADVAYKNRWSSDPFRIDGKIYINEQKLLAEKIEELARKYSLSEDYREYKPVEIGSVGGFTIGFQHTGLAMQIFIKHNLTSYSDFQGSGLGAITRITNMLERIDSHPDRIEQEIAQLQRRLEISTEQLAKPFEYTDELNKLLERKAFLDAQLEFGAADESSVLIDEDNEEGHEIA